MLKKLKEKLSKKKIITIGIAIIAIITTIVAIMLNQTETKTKKKKITADSELARAMTYDQFNDGDDSIDGTNNVKFSAFFLRDINNDGYAEKIKGTCKEIGKEDTLYMELNVLTDGYLENGVITVNSDNFYLQTAIPKDGEVKDNVISNNTKQIALNQINNGTQKLLTGIVRSGDYSYDSQKYAAIGNSPSNYSKVNSITLTGTYVGSDGTRTEISKTVELNVDWYGETRAEISDVNQSKDNTDVIDEENQQAMFEFNILMSETNNQLVLSKAYLEGIIPQLNGYDPLSVETKDTNINFSYDKETKKFTATKEAMLNAEGSIESQCYNDSYCNERRNRLNLILKYPLAAYNITGNDTVELKIPVQGYYEGFNNINSEFNNPYKSNTAKATMVITYSKPQGKKALYRVNVGKYMYNPIGRYVVSKKNVLKLYNEISTEENNDTYIVNWYGFTGSEGNSTGITLKETKNGEAQVSDQFIKADSSTESMEELTSNIGIYFGDLTNLLGEEGWIKIYDDETGILIHEFNKSEWAEYSENNPYKYDLPVKHIKIVTSETKANASINVYNIKKLDDEKVTTKYNREQFDSLKYIKSTLTGYLGEENINTDTQIANYEANFSLANISINKDKISTQETEKNMQIKIETVGDEKSNQDKWQNGVFLVKLPKDIIDLDIRSIDSSDSNVVVDSYETYENNGERFIKIITSNEELRNYMLTINCEITPNPRKETVTEDFELYASNENTNDYYNSVEDIYDINDNLNTKEMVNKSTKAISLISPNSLLTNQMATNYDDEGSVAIAPQIAVINKERRSATVNIEVNNNYSSTISEVKVLGRVPFEGNKYTINGSDMGSTFTATMTNNGIQLSDNLKGIVKIYYTENGEATKDLSDNSNGWTQTPKDYSKVKSYLVDFGNYQLAKGEKQVITYDINIPQGLEYNEVAYSHHAVYFSLDTTEGKYRTQTEPNKVGFMIAKKYDLELTKYQKNKDNIVNGATYAIYEDGQEEKRTRVTGHDGKLSLTGLYIGKTYVVKEIKSPSEYELNEEIVKFTTSENDGKISVEKIDGNVKNIQTIQPNENDGYKVQIEVEDEVKARLKIVKTEKNTENKIGKVRYKLTGTGISATGRIITTNTFGEVTTVGLKIGGEYTLEEVKAEGYYVEKERIKFTITNTNGTYELNVSEGTTKESTIAEENNIPTATLKLEDEKIPTYDLEISKIKRITDTAVTEDELKSKAEQALSSTDTVYLSGAKFRLYKDDKEIGEYVTDSNGKIIITGLYQYIDGKDEGAVYSLKEVLPPDGYTKAKDITLKVDGSTGELKLVNTNGENEPYTVDGNTVKLVMENSPSFKLIKKDAETQQTLANVKFAIYNIDDDSTKPATNSKGETIGTKETINGKEYYTVTTDERGELTADLPQGMYKAIEVQADEKYDLTNATYYFGIGASEESETKVTIANGNPICLNKNINIIKIKESQDGGFLMLCEAEYGSDFGNNIIKNNNDEFCIIKFDKNYKAQMIKTIACTADYSYLYDFAETSDGGFVLVGYFTGNLTLENGETLINNSTTKYHPDDGVIIKYSKSGEIEWTKVVGGGPTDSINKVYSDSNGKIIVSGYFNYWETEFATEIDLGDGKKLDNTSQKAVIRYDLNGKVEGFISNYSNSDTESVIDRTSDNGFIIYSDDKKIIKYNSDMQKEWEKDCDNKISEINLVSDNGYIVIDEVSNVMKYSSNWELEWQKKENVDLSLSEETNDGGLIFTGYTYNDEIKLSNGKVLKIQNKTSRDSTGVVIKYNEKGEIEFAGTIGDKQGTDIFRAYEDANKNIKIIANISNDSITLDDGNIIEANRGIIGTLGEKEVKNEEVVQSNIIEGSENEIITSTSKCNDGGIVIGGRTDSNDIDLGNGVKVKGPGALIIRYGIDGNVKWKKIIENCNEIEGIVETSDGGIVAVGSFNSNISLEKGINLSSKGYYDGLIIKYDNNGELEWATSIGGSDNETIYSVIETEDGGIVVGGDFNSKSIELSTEISLTKNKETYSGMIIKYSSTGNIEWAKNVSGNESSHITTLANLQDRGIIAGGYFSGNINLENGVRLSEQGMNDGMIIKYNIDGETEWAKSIGGTKSDQITSVTGTNDGGVVIGGISESDIKLENGVNLVNKGLEDGIIIKYNNIGGEEWGKAIRGSDIDQVVSVEETIDGGIIVGGNSHSSNIELDKNVGLKSDMNSNGMIIKYTSDGKIDWTKLIKASDGKRIVSAVTETIDGDIMSVGFYGGNTIEIDGKKLINKGKQDGIILKIASKSKIQETEELTVENKRKEYKITTDVKEINGTKGGSISGEDAQPYETVKYGESSTKEIKMIPNTNYEIIKITVNGKEYPFTVNEDGTYTMPVFTNMTEDKKVVVTYSLKDNKIIINKVDCKTKEKLKKATFRLDQIEERTKPQNVIGKIIDSG